MNYRILIVDDDLAIQGAIKMALKGENFELHFSSHPVDAFNKLQNESSFDLLLLDMHFPNGSGLDLLKKIQESHQRIPCLIISGAATAKEAVEGIKLGAFDYIEKPLSSERLKLSIQSCLNFHHQWLTLNTLTRQSSGSHLLIGNSHSMHEIRNAISRYSPSDVRVLITGETGSGKEVVAHAIVKHSMLSEQKFLIINSAAIPDSLMESELFGHRRGSFTGATSDRIGKIEMAHGGTLFFDEIGDLSLQAQAKLLRFLETGEIQKVGDTSTKKVKVRVIAATSRNLEKMIERNEFRADLYYRLNVARIHIPPLRQRIEDIKDLFHHFITNLQLKSPVNERSPLLFSIEIIQILEKYSWPGNIRELRNFAERCYYEDTSYLSSEKISNLLPGISETQETHKIPANESHELISIDSIQPLKAYRQKIEKDYIEKAIKLLDGNISKTARKLEIDRSYLHQKISEWNSTEKI